jgi:uncharacterized ParB-like nuclease family protein
MMLSLDLLPAKGSACQLRTARDPQTVARYAEAYADGVKMPPVVVFRETVDGHTVYHLADGHHRTDGAREAGLVEIEADVREGSHRDAILFAAGANGQHGLPLTNDDKWAIVATILADQEWVQWSDREIASRCHVSASLVAKVRKKTGSTSATRKGKDGATRSLPTKKKTEAPAGAEAGPAPTPAEPTPPAPVAEPEELTTDLTAAAPAPVEPSKAPRPAKKRPLAERRAEWLRGALASAIEAAHSFAGTNAEQAALILLCGADTDVEGVWSEVYVQKASHGLHTTLCRNVAEDLRNGQAHRLPDWRTLARLFGVDYDALSIIADRSIPE